MPKFNEFIKGFEEKAETEQPKVEPAPKTGEPKVEAPKTEQPKVNIAPKIGEPQGKEQVQPKLKKQEEPSSQEYEGYRLERTPDGKWINRDTYEYFDNKVEAQKDIDKFISSQSPNKPKEAEKPAPLAQAPQTPEAPKPTKQVKFNPKGQYGNVAYWLQKAGYEPSEVNEEGGYIKVKNNEGKDYEIRGSGKPYEYNVFENGKQIYKGVPDSAVFENILSGKDLESFERYRASETPEQSPAEIASAHFGKEMTPTKWSENTFETDDGEEWFIGTEEEAREEAKEQIKSLADDMGLESFNPDFQDWILRNALDETFISDLQDEEADYLEGDGQMEEAEQIRSMSLDDFAEYLRGNYGDKEFSDLISRNNAIDWDKVAEEAIDWDGIAHFIASYDGEEEELPNGLFAYRIN